MSFQVRLAVLISLGLICSGCHRMMTIKTNQPDCDIYVNGDHVGRGTATVKRMGLPETAIIKVEHGDHVETHTISRSMTLPTIGLGVISMYTGFLWAWEYPESVDIDLPTQTVGKKVVNESEPWTEPWTGSPFKTRIKKTETARSTTEKSDSNGTKTGPTFSSSKKHSGDPWTQPLSRP